MDPIDHAPGIPLPTDEQLTPEALEALGALPPLNVFRAVAVLPETLRPFLELGASLLSGSNLTPIEREFAILRVAHRTGASYERHQHEQLAAALGMSNEHVEATSAPNPEDLLPPDAALLCRAADEITQDVRLSDDALTLVRERWGDNGATELILTVGYYNMVSRFLESARVPREATDLLTNSTPAQIVQDGRNELG